MFTINQLIAEIAKLNKDHPILPKIKAIIAQQGESKDKANVADRDLLRQPPVPLNILVEIYLLLKEFPDVQDVKLDEEPVCYRFAVAIQQLAKKDTPAFMSLVSKLPPEKRNILLKGVEEDNTDSVDSLLPAAVRKDNVELLQALLEAKVDVNRFKLNTGLWRENVGHEGEAALEIQKLLFKHGYQLNSNDLYGQDGDNLLDIPSLTPFHVLCQQFKDAPNAKKRALVQSRIMHVLEVQKEAKLDVMSANREGVTPFMLVCSTGNVYLASKFKRVWPEVKTIDYLLKLKTETGLFIPGFMLFLVTDFHGGERVFPRELEKYVKNPLFAPLVKKSWPELQAELTEKIEQQESMYLAQRNAIALEKLQAENEALKAELASLKSQGAAASTQAAAPSAVVPTAFFALKK